MDIAVLGTGSVGRTLARGLAGVGHTVVVGTRDPAQTRRREDWLAADDITLDTFAEAAAGGEVIVNATNGAASLSVLGDAGVDNLAGKVILDVANPLDFSQGFPPTLSVKDTDSLAEQIQRAFPEARVVKSLNTVNCALMVDPARVPGEHQIFVSGEDDGAKEQVTALLGEFGWPARRVIDLGGIRTARAVEMYLPLWLALFQSTGTSEFNVEVRRAR